MSKAGPQKGPAFFYEPAYVPVEFAKVSERQAAANVVPLATSIDVGSNPNRKIVGEVCCMAGWWTIVRIAHVLSACIWVGALVAFTFFIRPKAESLLEKDASEQLLDGAGRTLGFFIAGVLVPVQLFTGLALLMHRGARLGSLASGLYGKLIIAKIVIFFVVVGISAAHGVASTRAQKKVSQSLAFLALLGSIVLAALGAALIP